MSTSKRRLEELSASLASRAGGKRPRPAKKASLDPSAKYLANPLAAPVVARWRARFGKSAKVFVGPSAGWRSVAKLAARRIEGKLVLGLFAPKSHDVVESARLCGAHAPELNVAIAAVENLCGAGVSVYAAGEKADTGSLSYVAVATAAKGKVIVYLVFNASLSSTAAAKACHALSKALSKAPWLHSLHAHYNVVTQHDNAIFGRGGPETWKLLLPAGATAQQGFACDLTGLAQLSLKGCAAKLFFAPPCFRQANLDQFAAIVRKIETFVPKKARVVELYGGVGTIGANLLRKARSVECSDENPWNAACVARTIDALAPDQRKRLTYETKPAAAVAREGGLGECDVVIVDPPRKGLCPDVVAALLRPALQPRLLVYVSCGFDALRRDLHDLSGKWTQKHVEAHVLFPGADHIETLVVLEEAGFAAAQAKRAGDAATDAKKRTDAAQSEETQPKAKKKKRRPRGPAKPAE
ncbi:hypothetical protein M885DRAFT_534028 [Pelagophyceae sp. CCMP2097]|nr:hypothetical protein M885DRAFT_534028 [Pelagophyceae sp. CCMP2097]|mmetsp:Transcript_14967/g.50194  ORF Transcript_14967/g.50194 Transcript_14967/m.50194 type:complete len:469 (+) Transcript_14967:185-1591(+)